MTHYRTIGHCSLAIIVAALALLPCEANAQIGGRSSKTTAHLADSANPSHTALWVTTGLGRNNSGIGVGIRYSMIGLSTTYFGFAGDTTDSQIMRPGGTYLSLDAIVALDASRWLAFYGNIGVAGRLNTYDAETRMLKPQHTTALLSVGGGMQCTLLSRFVLGIGYRVLIDSREGEGPESRAIQTLVLQSGLRL